MKYSENPETPHGYTRCTMPDISGLAVQENNGNPVTYTEKVAACGTRAGCTSSGDADREASVLPIALLQLPKGVHGSP